ncbi:MAG TPA: TonB family protein [Vicinamibacterales bacterium]
MLNPRLDRRTASRRMLAALGAALLIVALPVAALRAVQAGPAPLTGTIYDASGGVIPGATVTLTDAAQNRSVARSSAAGRFEFPSVAEGKYSLEVTLPGFRALRHDLELRNTHDWDRAVTLQIGDLRESISISAERTAPQQQAPAAGAPRRPVRVGGDVRAPRKTLDVKPVYPASMREAGLSGVVEVEAVIARDGTVSAVRVLSSQAHPDFAIAAADAVRQWRFSPTLLNGVPVEVMMNVSVRFSLN